MATLLSIIKKPRYMFVIVTVGAAMIIFAAWLPNLHLVTKTMTSQTMTFWQKTNLLASLLGSLQTNFTPFSQAVTVISAGLAGIQASLGIYYVRQTAHIQKTMGTSVLGIMSSLLGIGCASCGSVVLTSLLGLGSATALLGVLPLKGQEFGLLGIALLLFATIFTMKKINDPYVCKVTN